MVVFYGRWPMGDGCWTRGNVPWTMGGGRWTMRVGLWLMGGLHDDDRDDDRWMMDDWCMFMLMDGDGC